MKSIIQSDKSVCYLCGRNANFDSLDEHHVYGGRNRKLSEKYGLKVRLHHSECHETGKNSVHMNAEADRKLKAEVQRIAMGYYGWSTGQFIKIFGKSYI